MRASTNGNGEVSTLTFYHFKPERFAEMCQRVFPYTSFDYREARRTVSMPALLSYAGYPLAGESVLLSPQGSWSRVVDLHALRRLLVFKCAEPKCAIGGDVVQMWYLMVKLSGFASPYWNKKPGMW